MAWPRSTILSAEMICSLALSTSEIGPVLNSQRSKSGASLTYSNALAAECIQWLK